MSIGRNVYRLRQAREISQLALADAIGVHQTHISSIERDDKTPSLQVAQQLAHYFGISMDALLGADESLAEDERQAA